MSLTVRKEHAAPAAPAGTWDRLKLLRYCLARLRAWRSEYELYSLRRSMEPEASRASDPPLPVAVQSIQRRAESLRIVPEEKTTPVALRVDEALRDFIPQSVIPEVPVEESEMYARETRWMSSTVGMDRLVPDPSPIYGGTIDTESVRSHGEEIYTSTVSPSPVPRRADAGAYKVESPRPVAPRPEGGKVLPEAAGPSGGRRIEPLPGLGTNSSALASTPAVAKWKMPRVLGQILADAPEHWKNLAQAVAARVQESGLHKLMVTTALRGEGGTSVSLALAYSIAQHAGLRVVLVDGHFAHPGIASMLRLPARVGLEHHLRDHVALADTMVGFEKLSLDVLAVLEPTDLPNIVLGHERVDEVIERLSGQYDLVIVDQGAMFATRKPARIPAAMDAALLVRDPSKSGPELLDQLDAYVARHRVSSLGVIENGVEE